MKPPSATLGEPVRLTVVVSSVSLTAVEAELAAAEADVTRFEALLASNSGSRKQRDDAVARRNVTRERLQGSRDRVRGAQAVLSLAIAGAMASLGGPDGLALVCGLLAASVAGFLVHNWHPAEIFMGDSGSTFLGFVFGSLAASAWFEPAPAAIPAASWLCPLAPFLADTTVTLARRILKGERWYAAHRQHFYQWLIGRGWSHRRVAGAYLATAAVLGVMSAAYHAYGFSPALLVGGCLTVITAAARLAWRVVSGCRGALYRRESLPSAGLGHSLR